MQKLMIMINVILKITSFKMIHSLWALAKNIFTFSIQLQNRNLIANGSDILSDIQIILY